MGRRLERSKTHVKQKGVTNEDRRSEKRQLSSDTEHDGVLNMLEISRIYYACVEWRGNPVFLYLLTVLQHLILLGFYLRPTNAKKLLNFDWLRQYKSLLEITYSAGYAFLFKYLHPVVPLGAQDMLVAGDGSLSASEEDLAAFHRSLRSMKDCHIKVRFRASLDTRRWLYMLLVTRVCSTEKKEEKHDTI